MVATVSGSPLPTPKPALLAALTDAQRGEREAAWSSTLWEVGFRRMRGSYNSLLQESLPSSLNRLGEHLCEVIQINYEIFLEASV